MLNWLLFYRELFFQQLRSELIFLCVSFAQITDNLNTLHCCSEFQDMRLFWVSSQNFAGQGWMREVLYSKVIENMITQVNYLSPEVL